MAALFITEYAGLAPAPPGGVGQVPLEPPLAEQSVTIAAGHAESNAFNAQTRLIRLEAGAICSVLIGTAPVAATTSGRIAANQSEYRGVPKTGTFKVSVIQNS
jgi:hypothetical protein